MSVVAASVAIVSTGGAGSGESTASGAATSQPRTIAWGTWA